MARRAARKKLERERLTLSVRAAAALVWRMDSNQAGLFLGAKAITKIRIEGTVRDEACKVEREALLLVSRETVATKVAGYALGGTTPWTVSSELPDEQFRDLLSFVLADKLHTVEMAFDKVRWHKGTLLSVDFGTLPLPSERD